MKRLLFAFAAIMLTATAANAQEKTSMSAKPVIFSIGVEPSLPIGKFGDAYSFGIGGSLQAEYKVAEDLGLTLNAGYINYSGKDYTIGNTTYKGGSSGIVPVMAGAKYYFSPKVYGHGQLGVGIGTSKGATSSFAYSPGVGFMLSRNFDVLFKYVGYSQKGGSSNTIGARLAYNF